MNVSGAPVLGVDGLTVTFEGAMTPAVSNVSFSVDAGEALAIVGESGSGKSVTALSIMGLLPPNGRVVDGVKWLGDAELNDSAVRSKRGREIAMIFQEPMTALNPVLTIGDQLIESIRQHQRVAMRTARDEARAALQSVGLADTARVIKAYPHELSGGMCQRVMIAMAIVCKPQVLLADEPTTALDVTVQMQILDVLDELRTSRDMALVLITHDLGVVAERADRVCVMYRGSIVEIGPTASVLCEPYHPYTRALLGCRPELGCRRDRLQTVHDAVTAGRNELIDGRRAWWPDSDSESPAMKESKPGHWVLCEGQA